METEVHEALGNVFLANTRGGFKRTQIDDALVGDSAAATGVQHRIVAFQTLRDVVGAQDRNLSRFRKTLCTHHGYIHP